MEGAVPKFPPSMAWVCSVRGAAERKLYVTWVSDFIYLFIYLFSILIMSIHVLDVYI